MDLIPMEQFRRIGWCCASLSEVILHLLNSCWGLNKMSVSHHAECCYLMLQVQIGDELLAAVKVQDRSSNFLLAEHFELMGLVPKMDARSRSYVRVTRIESTDPHTAMFAVRGVELGTARLSFTAQAQVNSVVISNAEDIQVLVSLPHRRTNILCIYG